MHTLGEKGGISLDQLAGHGSGGQLGQGLTAVGLVSADRNLLDLVDGHQRRSSQTLDDGLRADTLLDVLLDLFEDLTSEDDNRSRTIAHLSILGPGNIDEDSGGGVNDIEKL